MVGMHISKVRSFPPVFKVLSKITNNFQMIGTEPPAALGVRAHMHANEFFSEREGRGPRLLSV